MRDGSIEWNGLEITYAFGPPEQPVLARELYDSYPGADAEICLDDAVVVDPEAWALLDVKGDPLDWCNGAGWEQIQAAILDAEGY